MEKSILSSWASNISPSPTLAVDAKAKELKAAGHDICAFAAGEPDFDTPEFIKEACVKALSEGKTKYAPAPGIMPLREALAEKYRTENGIESATATSVVVSPGGKYSCYLAMLAVCQPGDEVLIPTPYWVSYPEMAKLTGATPTFIEAGIDNGFKITPDQLRDAITPRTKLLILNSPSNPTGAIYTPDELRALMDVVLEKDILVMSDEIYEYLLYDGAEHASPASFSAEHAEKVITVAGFSKTFSMTGWRLGTLLAPAKIAKAIASLQSQTSSNATTFAQYGALAALEEKEKSKAAVADMLKVFDRRRLHMWESLSAMDGIECYRSTGAFYLFPSIKGLGMDSTTFASRLLEEAQVAVVPGVAFGADDCMRMSYATSDEIINKGLERIQNFCAKL